MIFQIGRTENLVMSSVNFLTLLCFQLECPDSVVSSNEVSCIVVDQIFFAVLCS